MRKASNSGSAAVSIPSCGGVSLKANLAYACLTVDAVGVCTADTECEINFDAVDVDDDDQFDEKDDDDDDDNTIAGLTVAAFAGVMIGVAVILLIIGGTVYRRQQQTREEPTHVLMKD